MGQLEQKHIDRIFTLLKDTKGTRIKVDDASNVINSVRNVMSENIQYNLLGYEKNYIAFGTRSFNCAGLYNMCSETDYVRVPKFAPITPKYQ